MSGALSLLAEQGISDLVFARKGLVWVPLLTMTLAGLAYLWGAQARRKGVESLGNPALIERLLATVDHGKRVLRAALVLVTMGLVGVAMLRLQYGGVARVLPTRGLDIVLAVDYSKSMLAEDVYPSRSERLEAELTRFIDESGRRGDRVGVVIFAGAARSFPVTSDMGVLSLFLEHADPRTENPGGTAIGKALDKSIDLLVAVRRDDSGARADQVEGEDDSGAPEVAPALSEADQVIVLLTDGEDTVGRPEEVAARAEQLGIRIYTVGIGSDSGEPIMRYDADGQPAGYATDADGKPVMTRLDEGTLKTLADQTRGKYVRVKPESFGLDAIRKEVEGLAKAQREAAVEIHREEAFAFFTIPAVLVLSLALGLGDRRRPPAQARRTAHLRRRTQRQPESLAAAPASEAGVPSAAETPEVRS